MFLIIALSFFSVNLASFPFTRNYQNGLTSPVTYGIPGSLLNKTDLSNRIDFFIVLIKD